MRSGKQLAQIVRGLDGKGYRAYKEIRGSYAFGDFELHIEHVQGDPFAEPSKVSVTVAAEIAGLPAYAIDDAVGRRAAADFLNRQFCRVISKHSTRSGSGKSGLIEMLEPGQQVLERSSLKVTQSGEVLARFRVGLPANGRRIAGRAAEMLLTKALVESVRDSLLLGSWDEMNLRKHCETVQDSVALRGALAEKNLIAFIADGSRLPRRSGADDRPARADVVHFEAPESMG